MIGALSNNVLISGMYGLGIPRAIRPSAPAGKPGSPISEPAAGKGGERPDADVAEISSAGRQAARALELQQAGQAARRNSGLDAGIASEPDEADLSKAFVGELSAQEKEHLDQLKERDREVRAHEDAHKRAAGQYAKGGPKFEYEQGPDGKRYATNGEVQIDTSPVPNDPAGTIRKMQQVRRAALAPVEPSSQDRAVAAQSLAVERQARTELSRKKKGQGSRSGGGVPPADPEQKTEAVATRAAEPAWNELAISPPLSERTGYPAIAQRYLAAILSGVRLDAIA